MAVKAFDLTEYKHLLAEAHPALIETEEENQRVLALVHDLMRKQRKSREEQKLLDLLARLVEDFEAQHYELKGATPDQVLRRGT